MPSVRAALADPRVVGGAFRLRFESRSPALRLIEWGARLRVALWRLPYGDQALFVRRSVLEELGGVPQAPIMEDLDLVRSLQRRGRIACLPLAVTTSARRYRAHGTLRGFAAQRTGGRRLAAGTAARADRRVVSPVNADAGRARPSASPCAAWAATCCATAAITRSGPRRRSPTSRDSSPCRCSSAGRSRRSSRDYPAQEVVRRVLWLATRHARAARWCATSRARSSSTPRARSSTSCATTSSPIWRSFRNRSTSAGAPATS